MIPGRLDSFSTRRRTAEHVVWNVECWTDLMRGYEPRHRPDGKQSIADLTERFEVASVELLEFARKIVAHNRLDDTFVDTLDTPPCAKSFGGAIVHVATHGMHHRAQLLFMLRRLGVEDLPEGDALSWEQSVTTSNPEVPSSSPPPVSGEIDPAPTKGEMRFLDSQFTAFNTRQAGRDDFEPIELVIRGDDGSVIAGLQAMTGWDWLYVQILWVHEGHRRAGLGWRLLEHAECETKQRGCIGSCLTSYTFQSPAFYEQHGYSEFGRIENYPADNSMIFFSKLL
jgi:uncharacterized damage-inducible protein DinB/GNAT superfamily N-acetyltransferase